MGLNNINSKSTWGQAASDINTNFTTIDSDLKKVKNATTRNKGYFSTSSELISAFPTASKGDIAYVGSSYPYDIWKWNGGSWAKSGSTGGEESVNLGNYYTKVETDEKFTEADAKLSELSEEISGLRTETDQKLSETSEEISGLRTKTDQKLSELGSEVKEITNTVIVNTSGVQGFIELPTIVPIGDYTCEYEYSGYGEQFYYAQLYSDPNGGVDSALITSQSASSKGKGSVRITLTNQARSLRIGVGGGTIPSDAVFKIKLYKEKKLVYENDITDTISSEFSNPISSRAVYTLKEKITELEGNFLDTLLDVNVSSSGYFQLNKTAKAGTPIKVKLKFNPWGVYTTIIAYTVSGGGDNESIGDYFYTIDKELVFTPTIDVNFIRVNCSTPNSGANGYISVTEEKVFVSENTFNNFANELEKKDYIGDEIKFIGKSGYKSLGAKLYKGHKYRFKYNVKNYKGEFYYIQLADGYNPKDTVINLGGVGASTTSGSVDLVITSDVDTIRIGTGSSVPEDAETSIDIHELPSYSDKLEVDRILKELDSKLSKNTISIESFFEEEMQKTINSVNDLTNQRCFVIPIVTDNHWRWTTEEGNNVKDRSINNVKYFNSRVYCDGVVHIGDILDSGVVGESTDKELYDLIQRYLLQLSTANRHFYAINGNHDGSKLSMFDEMKWYGMIGRATANEDDVHRYMTTPYYYIDHKPTKLRIVCLANPDNVTGVGITWGFSQRELDWLETEALNVPQDYSVLFITHIAPIKGYVDSAANLESFASLCNEFNDNHTGKIVGVICGHSHVDLLVTTEWTYEGFSNILPCPIVLLGSNYYNLGTEDRLGEFGGIIYGRVPNTETEDLWTVLVYTPDSETKCNFIRFGAGADVAF